MHIVNQNKEGLEILVVVPGVEEKDIAVTVEGKCIVLEVKSDDSPFIEKGIIDKFRLSDIYLDLENITASYKNGIVKVVVPSKENVKKIIPLT